MTAAELCQNGYGKTVITVFFKNGRVVSMNPKFRGPLTDMSVFDRMKQQIYSCNVVVSDGDTFDLRNKEQIYAIPIPDYAAANKNHPVSTALGTTGYLEYVLRMKASQYKNMGNDDLAYACLGQANKLMLFSDMRWPEKEYWRIVEWLEKDGRFKLAAKWEDWIHENVPTLLDWSVHNFRQAVDECVEDGTGLIELSWEGAQCGTVAKYQGRVYSIPGYKNKFPIIPAFILENGYITPQGTVKAYPFHMWNDPDLDTINYKGENCPALKTSWRPFVDDRSPADKQNYYARMQEILEKEHKEKNRRLYIRLRYAFQDLCPERLSTFYGWTKTKPDRYQQIVDAAEAAGLDVPHQEFQMPDDLEPPDPDQSYRGGRTRPLRF